MKELATDIHSGERAVSEHTRSWPRTFTQIKELSWTFTQIKWLATNSSKSMSWSRTVTQMKTLPAGIHADQVAGSGHSPDKCVGFKYLPT